MKAFAMVAVLGGVALLTAGLGIAQLVPQEQAATAAPQQAEQPAQAQARSNAGAARLYAARRAHERSAGPGNW